MEHICTGCFQPSERHEARCEDEAHGDQVVRHWPPLCCPGCDCHSYERAHPEENRTPFERYVEDGVELPEDYAPSTEEQLYMLTELK